VYESISTRPTPLNAVLWAANVNAGDQYHLAYYSVFDKKAEVDFVTIDKAHNLLGQWADHEKVHRLIRLSQNEYVISLRGDTMIFNDLRFGQFNEPSTDGEFVFAYKLIPNGEDLIVEEIPPPRPEGDEFNDSMSGLYERALGE
jgi:inner membrane protein